MYYKSTAKAFPGLIPFPVTPHVLYLIYNHCWTLHLDFHRSVSSPTAPTQAITAPTLLTKFIPPSTLPLCSGTCGVSHAVLTSFTLLRYSSSHQALIFATLENNRQPSIPSQPLLFSRQDVYKQAAWTSWVQVPWGFQQPPCQTIKSRKQWTRSVNL